VLTREVEQESMLITSELTVAEVLTRWPETIPVFLKQHMHCVGCSMSAFDTMVEAASNYGLNWDSFAADLNLVIQPNQTRK
jgi:hybrid cluster-associated redox disulfide protein